MIMVEKRSPIITETELQFTKINLGLDNVQKIFRQIIFQFLTAIKFNSFQQSSLKSLNWIVCLNLRMEIPVIDV